MREKRKPTMEVYKYPLISQPNSVHYATCLGLVFCQYEYLFTRLEIEREKEWKSEQFKVFVSFSLSYTFSSLIHIKRFFCECECVCVGGKIKILKKINKTR